MKRENRKGEKRERKEEDTNGALCCLLVERERGGKMRNGRNRGNRGNGRNRKKG